VLSPSRGLRRPGLPRPHAGTARRGACVRVASRARHPAADRGGGRHQRGRGPEAV